MTDLFVALSNDIAGQPVLMQALHPIHLSLSILYLLETFPQTLLIREDNFFSTHGHLVIITDGLSRLRPNQGHSQLQ